jgi:hypothetical protein
MGIASRSSRDFAIDEHVLHFLAPRCTQRVQPITGTAIPDDEIEPSSFRIDDDP